jgi:hypothetical protein
MTRVRIQVPGDSSTLITASGDVVNTTVDETGRRWAELLADDARAILNSGLSSSLPWRELNPGLIGGALGPISPPVRGIRWVDLLQAAEDARPRHWNDKGGHALDALRAVGRWSR